MLSTDVNNSTFKLFGKFGLNHLKHELQRQQYDESDVHTNRSNDTTTTTTNHGNQIDSGKQLMRAQQRKWRTYACIIFSILSSLLAGLFAMEHLINLLSIGTLVMVFTVTIDIMILRYSSKLKQRLHSPILVNGNLSAIEHRKSKLSLITILLLAYCLLAIILTIYVRLATTNTITVSTTAFWTVNGILAIGLLVIVFMLGMQSKGNAIFTLSFLHPMPPAIVLLASIYLCTAIDVAAWIRFTIWMVIGIIFYMFFIKWKRQPKKTIVTSVINGGFVHEIETTTQIDVSNDEQLPPDQACVKIEVNSLPNQEKSSISHENLQNQISVDEMQSENYSELMAIDTSASNDLLEMKTIPKPSSPPQPERKPLPPQKGCYLDHTKLDEIASVDDVRHTIIECREPNGTTYFVEANTTTAVVESSLKDSNDDTITDDTANSSNQLDELSELEKIELERNIVERVLNQTDLQLASKQPLAIVSSAPAIDDDFMSDDNSVEEEREIYAIVHATNSRFNSPMYTPPPTPITQTPPPPPPLPPSQKQHKVHLFEKRSQTVRVPNFRIETYEAQPTHKLLYENNQSRHAFKLHLESLFKQNDETRAPKTQFASPVARYSHRILPYNHSMSTPESLVISSNGDGVDDMADIMEKSTVPLSLPPPIIASPSNVPSAPVFNQQLYDTIGRRNRMAFTTTPNDVIDIDDGNKKNSTSKSAPQTLQKSRLQRAKAHENLAHLDDDEDDSCKNEEIPNIDGIRKQLENIFSKGRTIQADVIDLDMNQNENVPRNRRCELIDTVRMQKMRFSSVLKSIESIGPDIHANLHPTNTLAANDIQQEIKRRESNGLNGIAAEQEVNNTALN